MSFFASRTKRKLYGMGIAAVLGIISISQAAADTGTDSSASLLAQIASYTNGTLTAVTSTSNPVVTVIVAALTNLTSPDTATDPQTPTPALQQSFTSYVTQTEASLAAQTALQSQLATTLFSGFTASTVAYANDLSFSSLMGVATPVYNPEPRSTSPDSALNYLQYAAALNVTHTIPGSSWTGSSADQLTYTNFFNTAYAVQSFNGYVLSQLYEDIKNGVPTAQTTLVNQAAASTWIATIASESIGAVLRQTLMYQSQSYILLTQILQTEKMLLTAQTMNNSLITLGNMATEGVLRAKAIKRAPGS
jgi:hypothetical protein